MLHRLFPLLLLAALLPLGWSSADAVRARPADPRAPGDSLDLPETNYYEITTPAGRMVVRLYDETPVHRDNFKKLAAEGFYDSTAFHRVIRGFMIQGGDPNSKDDDPFDDGQGDPGYTLPAEIVPSLFHKRGALAAARTGDAVNPERRSSGSQFYIVQGRPHDDVQLAAIEAQIRAATGDSTFTFSEAAREMYRTVGGTPNLDMQYTVFGELVEGLDVLDRLAAAPTPRSTGQRLHPAVDDHPFERLYIVVRPLPEYVER